MPPFDTRQTSLAQDGCRGKSWQLVSFRVVGQRHRKLDHWNANTDFLWDKRTGLAAKTVKQVIKCFILLFFLDISRLTASCASRLAAKRS